MKNKSSLYLKITAVLLSIISVLGLLGSVVMLVQYSKEHPELFWKILMICLLVDILPIVMLISAIGLWRGNQTAVIITPILSCIALFLTIKFGVKDGFDLMNWLGSIWLFATICLPLAHKIFEE